MSTPSVAPAAVDTVVEHFERHADTLLGIAAQGLGRSVRARVDAADVVQEALLAALRRRAERPAAGSTSSWLSFLTREAALHVRRRHVRALRRSTQLEVTGLDARGASVREQEVNAASAGTGGDETPTALELAGLQNLLLELAPLDRRIVILRFWRGLGFAEIASSTGGTTEGCRKRCARALEMLKARSADGRNQPCIG